MSIISKSLVKVLAITKMKLDSQNINWKDISLGHKSNKTFNDFSIGESKALPLNSEQWNGRNPKWGSVQVICTSITGNTTHITNTIIIT